MVGGCSGDQRSTDDADVAVRVDEIAVDRVLFHSVDHQGHVAHRQSSDEIDKDGATEQARCVVPEVAVDKYGAPLLEAHSSAFPDQRYHALTAVGVNPHLYTAYHAYAN